MDIKADLYSSGPSRPSRLYKYTRWDKNEEQNACRHTLLTVPQLYFAPIKSFNDPFDCQLPRGWASKTNEEIRTYFRNKYGEDLVKNSSILKELDNDRVKCISIQNKADIDMTDSHSGVFCLSPDPTNSLLWAHYAAGHRGYCIGYNTNKTVECMESYCETPDLIFDSFNVEYRENLPVLDPFIRNVKEWFLQRYRYKSSDWSYEREYRFLLIKNEELQEADREVEISADCISEIVLGSRISEETETEIRQEVELLRYSNPNLKLLKAKMSEKSFGYDLIPID